MSGFATAKIRFACVFPQILACYFCHNFFTEVWHESAWICRRWNNDILMSVYSDISKYNYIFAEVALTQCLKTFHL